MNCEVGNADANVTPTTNAETTRSRQPLIKLMKSLINDNDEPITTNLLLNILRDEFFITSNTKSDLHMEIFVNVLKKFLKIWPRWDTFDLQMKNTPKEEQDQMLAVQCRKLKKYLKKKIEMAESQIVPTINKLESGKKGARKTFKDYNKAATFKPEGKCVLDVICTRERLINLIYNRPHGHENATLFNISDGPMLKNISLENNSLKFCDIINWPNLTVKVVLPNFEYTRTNSSHIDRKLVNLKNPLHSKKIDNLSSDLYWKSMSKKKAVFRKNILVSFIVQILHYISGLEMNETKKLNLTALFEEIKKDFLAASSQIHVNAEYQFFLSKYPFIRHICSKPEQPKTRRETDVNPHDFDLQLQELISPAITFQMPKFAVNFCEDQRGRIFLIDYAAFIDCKNNWLKLSCSSCLINFDGFLNFYEVEQHFTEMHNFEPPWKCTHCQSQFGAKELSLQRWNHVCKTGTLL